MTDELREAQLSSLGKSPALVVVDVQRDFGDPAHLAGYGLTTEALTDLDAALTRIGDLIDAARESGVPVVWVELGSDPALPWHSSSWLRSGDFGAPMGPDEPCVLGTAGAEWVVRQPADGELRVVKRGYSGFLGTDLEAQLRSAGYDWLTIVGLTTECCVAATAQDAMQLDWPVVIAQDATAAYNLDVQKAALMQLSLNVGVLADLNEVTALWTQVLA